MVTFLRRTRQIPRRSQQETKRIKFTAEIDTQTCNFLDLTIYKSPSFLSKGLLSTEIYKPTNTFSFHLGTSYTPKQIHRSIATGEATRLLRHTESPTLYKHYENRFIKKFEHTGYLEKILKELSGITRNMRLEICMDRRKDTYGKSTIIHSIV